MKSELNLDKMPDHVAIIMDGNGRWASSKGKNRLFGHKNGVQAVRAVVEESVRLGIKHLDPFTLFLQKIGSVPKKK